MYSKLKIRFRLNLNFQLKCMSEFESKAKFTCNFIKKETFVAISCSIELIK